MYGILTFFGFLRKSMNFSHFFWKIIRRKLFISVTSQNGHFLRKQTHLSKNFKFCQKTLFIAIKKYEGVEERLRICKCYGQQRDLNLPSPLPKTVTPGTCIMQDINDSADLHSARQGQFQQKEKKLRLLIKDFPFENFFRGKLILIKCLNVSKFDGFS